MKCYLYLIFTLLIFSSCGSENTKGDPFKSKTHYDLAIELAQYSLYENALEEFDLAIKFDPGNIMAYRKKGVVLFGLKQYDEAENLFAKTISLDPENVQAYINLGMVKYITGDKDGAIGRWGCNASPGALHDGLSEPTTEYGFRLAIYIKGGHEVFTVSNAAFVGHSVTLSADGTQEETLEFSSQVEPVIDDASYNTATTEAQL